MNITPEQWRQVEPLLGRALEMDAPSRAPWLLALDATRPEEAALVRRLIAAHERAERSRELETVPRLAPSPPWSSAFVAGARIGPFELIRPLGRGGMGEVWLARQADGRVERQVALKLPNAHLQDATWRERFRRERDILARLEHPHIARLYDAGVTEGGQPWLAMEYVEGSTLAQRMACAPMPLAERVALLRQVLAAVAHAHRHLVVHRDLKPANILIDAAGQVKLLDFGIAKLVHEGEAEADAAALTRAGNRMMTLRYAAPEQAAGGTVTTATDIYALGVILHEMVTGLAPYRAVREGRTLTETMLLQEDIALPSHLPIAASQAEDCKLASPRQVARRLAGDLDAILLKALRRDPAERYGSVELFDADLLAFLERRVVRARAGTWRYVAGRYVLRHKLPLAAVAAVLLTLLAGLVVADRERRVAVAERARAERHFASVRQLANAFVFDVDGEIAHLAGSLKARQALVGTAVRYLDSLAGESGDDAVLALELAGAYRRLAEIEGDSRGAHLGNPAGAERNASRAAALLEGIEARDPTNLAALREHRVVALFLGRLRLERGDAEGVKWTAKAAAIAATIASSPGATASDRRLLGATLAEYGGILAVVSDDHAAAAVQLARSVEILERVLAEVPRDLATRSSLAYAYERSAMGAEATGDPSQLPRAAMFLDESIDTLESVMHDDPLNTSHAQSLVKRYNNAARVRLKLADVAVAGRRATQGRSLVERLVASDPRDAGNASMLAGSLAMESRVEHAAGHHEKAIERARLAIAADRRLPEAQRQGLIVRDNVVGAKRSLGASACALARDPRTGSQRDALLAEGRAMLVESRDFKRQLVERGIEAREASRAIVEIDAELARCRRDVPGA